MGIEDNGEELTGQKPREPTQKLKEVREPGSARESSGILNIQRRLIIFSNTHDSLHVSRYSHGGLKVSITLDKKIKGDLTNETADR